MMSTRGHYSPQLLENYINSILSGKHYKLYKGI